MRIPSIVYIETYIKAVSCLKIIHAILLLIFLILINFPSKTKKIIDRAIYLTYNFSVLFVNSSYN